VIKLNYLTDPNDTDAQVLLDCVKFAHQLSTDTAHSPLANWTIGNVLPGLPESVWALPPSVLDPILLQIIHIALQQGYHFGGSVAMSIVLDETLQIPGVKGLRVSGVATHPKIVGFNPQLATYATSEKLADLIKKDRNQFVYYPLPLTVESLCKGEWKVTNPNANEAVFDWVARSLDTHEVLYKGIYNALAGSSAIIYSDPEPANIRMTIHLNGVLQGSAVNTAC